MHNEPGHLKAEHGPDCRNRIDPATFYQSYYPRVYNYVCYRVNNRQCAEDLVSQIFEKAFGAIEKYDPRKAAFPTWVFTIARNTVIDYYRSAGRLKLTSLDDALQLAGEGHSPEDRLCENEARGELLKALSQLSEREREIIALKFWSGCGNKEIAALLGITESNVGVILYRAMRKLKKTLEDNHFDYSSYR